MMDPRATLKALSWLLLRRKVSNDSKKLSKKGKAIKYFDAFLSSEEKIAPELKPEHHPNGVVEGTQIIISGSVKCNMG